MSFLTWSSSNLIAQNRAERPIIKNEFEILLPIMFPTATSSKPEIAASILTTNSGAEVPKATIVSAIIMFGTL